MNYEFIYTNIFNEISEGIYDAYNEYVDSIMVYYISLEIFGLLFYIIFYITVNFYLYYIN